MTSPIRYLLDPGLWCREILKHDPWQKQIEILESVRDNKTTAVKSCHAAGKSFVAAEIALWFLFNHPGSIVITTAPTDRQVSGILWREIRSAHSKAGLPGACLQTELKIDNDHFALGFTAPPYTAAKFQGFHAPYILIIVDESAGVSDDIFDAIDGILTSDESRLLLIGNPTSSSGRFYKEFSTASGANKISISAFDTPNFTRYGITERDVVDGTGEAKVTGSLPAPYLVTPGWVADRLKAWGRDSSLYQSRILANFPTAGDNSLIPLAWIEAAVNRDLPAGEPVEIGCDIARFGKDETVFMLREGPKARILKVLPMSDTMATSGEIVRCMRETGSTLAKVDSVGLGAGVFDRLIEQNVPVIEMQSGSAAQDRERYANARAEWWFSLRERFESGDISIPDDEELISQLASIKYKVDSRGRILIESKADMKSSPDRADALMFAFGDSGLSTNAAFSPARIDECVLQSPPAISRNQYEYLCAAGFSRKKDSMCIAVAHAAGQGFVIVDQVKYVTPEGTGQQYWISIFQEIMQARRRYGIEVFLVGSSLMQGLSHYADSYDSFSLQEIPSTSDHWVKIYDSLASLIQQTRIRLPGDDRLLRELRMWYTTYHGERNSPGDIGVSVIATLVDRLKDLISEGSFFGRDDRRVSIDEWRSDNDDDGQPRDNFGGGLMGSRRHDPEEGRP